MGTVKLLVGLVIRVSGLLTRGPSRRVGSYTDLGDFGADSAEARMRRSIIGAKAVQCRGRQNRSGTLNEPKRLQCVVVRTIYSCAMSGVLVSIVRGVACVGSDGKTCPSSPSGGGRPGDLGPDREAVGHHQSVLGR